MKVIYRLKKGKYEIASLSIQRSIINYSKNHSLKIGITSKPKSRASKYNNETNYDEMIVLFKSSSKSVIRSFEKFLIDKNWAIIDNEIGGGGGPLRDGPFYLYVIRKKKRENQLMALKAVAIVGGAVLGISLLAHAKK